MPAVCVQTQVPVVDRLIVVPALVRHKMEELQKSEATQEYAVVHAPSPISTVVPAAAANAGPKVDLVILMRILADRGYKVIRVGDLVKHGKQDALKIRTIEDCMRDSGLQVSQTAGRLTPQRRTYSGGKAGAAQGTQPPAMPRVEGSAGAAVAMAPAPTAAPTAAAPAAEPDAAADASSSAADLSGVAAVLKPGLQNDAASSDADALERSDAQAGVAAESDSEGNVTSAAPHDGAAAASHDDVSDVESAAENAGAAGQEGDERGSDSSNSSDDETPERWRGTGISYL